MHVYTTDASSFFFYVHTRKRPLLKCPSKSTSKSVPRKTIHFKQTVQIHYKLSLFLPIIQSRTQIELNISNRLVLHTQIELNISNRLVLHRTTSYSPTQYQGTHNTDSTHRVLTSKTSSQETMLPSAKFVIVVSRDKRIYYAAQTKLISCGILHVIHPTPHCSYHQDIRSTGN